MNAPRLLPFLLLTVAPSLAWGQHVLLVRDHGRLRAVVAADGMRPEVLENGKLRTLDVNQFILTEGGQYLPLYVAVHDPRVRTSSLTVNESVDQMNKTFHFSCDLESAYQLSHVFLVITLQLQGDNKSLFLYGVGKLRPRDPRYIDVAVPMQMDSAPGKYWIYLFSGGRELFQPLMPLFAMEDALNKLVYERIRNLTNSPPRPFIGPPPEYPKDLRKHKVTGEATVSFLIGMNGAVSQPKLVKTTRPEFGKAVMDVIRQWRFLPEVKDGQPVLTRVEMPFEFKPR